MYRVLCSDLLNETFFLNENTDCLKHDSKKKTRNALKVTQDVHVTPESQMGKYVWNQHVE